MALNLRDKLQWRAEMLTDNRVLPLSHRIAAVLKLCDPPHTENEQLLSRLRRDESDAAYFDLPQGKIYFEPAGVEDHEQLMEGTLLLLREVCMQESDFFHGPVQLDRGDVVLDLGGNLGTSAMQFAAAVGSAGKVYSFEPIFADLLQRNLEVNGIEGVEVEPVAVGDRDGTVQFNVTDLGVDSRMSEDVEQRQSVEVPIVRLDSWMHERGCDRVDLIKMDIEGAERLALEGMRETLARHHPKLTIASYHTDAEAGQLQHPLLKQWLEDFGYELTEQTGPVWHLWAWQPE